MKNNCWLKKKKSPMGIGKLGDNNVVFIRKWRWTIEFFKGQESVVAPEFVRVKFPPWESATKELKITYLGAAGLALSTGAENLWATLCLYDGCGTLLEKWHIKGVTIQTIQMSLPFDDMSFERDVSFKYEIIKYESIKAVKAEHSISSLYKSATLPPLDDSFLI